MVVVIFTISGFCLALIDDLPFDYRFEQFFPTEDPELNRYKEHIAQFDTDSDFFFLGIENPAGVYKQDFLLRVDSLTRKLQSIKHIKKVISPTNLQYPLAGSGPIIMIPFLHLDQPSKLAEDSTFIQEMREVTAGNFSEDGKSINIYIDIDPQPDKSANDSLVTSVEKCLAEASFEHTYLIGKLNGQLRFIDRMSYELVLYSSLATLLLVVVLWISFRSFWGIWVPLLVVGLTVIWVLGFMRIIDEPLNLLSVIMPTILFVVGVSDVVHLLERYFEELRKGLPKIAAIRTAFKEVGLATFLTSLTTAIGFLTLLTSSAWPIRVFGSMIGLGVLIAFILAFTLLPAILILSKIPKLSRKPIKKYFWTWKLHALFKFVLKRQKWILIGSFLLVGLTIVGIKQLKVDNLVLADWAVDDEYRQGYMFFEEQYSGNRPFEIAIAVKDSGNSILDLPVLKEIEKLENLAEEVYECRFKLSPVGYVKIGNMAMNGGFSEEYQLPDSPKKLKKVLRKFRRQRHKLRPFMTKDERSARISGKIKDFGGYRMTFLNQRFDSLAAATIDNELVEYHLTGMGRLVDLNNRKTSGNLLKGLLIALGAISIILFLLFRSWKMLLISIIPNLLPLLMIAAFMGFAGIDMKITTSLVFTIAFGIAVDDTIHFVGKLKIELGKGKSRLYALKRAYLSTGKAIVVTSIILFTGFMALVSSKISTNFYIGLLISLALIFALIADLLVLPALFLWLYPGKKKRKE